MTQILARLQEQVRVSGPIIGFHYPFARLLADRLKQLIESRRVASEESREWWKNHEKGVQEGRESIELSEEGAAVCHSLRRQLSLCEWESETLTLPDLEGLLKAATDFLAIFEATPEKPAAAV